jgi:hypothetical protein
MKQRSSLAFTVTIRFNSGIYLHAHSVAQRPIIKQAQRRQKQNKPIDTKTKEGNEYHLDSSNSVVAAMPITYALALILSIINILIVN